MWCRQHSAVNLLTTDLKEDHGLPYHSWLCVTAESETPDKGTTVGNNVLFNKHIKNVYMQRDCVWKTVVLTSLRAFFNFHFYLHKMNTCSFLLNNLLLGAFSKNYIHQSSRSIHLITFWTVVELVDMRCNYKVLIGFSSRTCKLAQCLQKISRHF